MQTPEEFGISFIPSRAGWMTMVVVVLFGGSGVGLSRGRWIVGLGDGVGGKEDCVFSRREMNSGAWSL